MPKKPAVAPAKAAVEYTDVRMDPEVEKKYKAKRVAVQKSIRDGAFPSQQEQRDFEEYYQNYSFARWDDLEQAYLTSDFRLEVSRELQLGKAGGAPHQRLVDMAMEFCTARIKDPKSHPAVRVNAMLLIGDLNERESRSPTENPVPLPAAIPLLVEALNDPQQIDGVKAAALVGIIRHVTLGVADPAVLNNQIVPALLQLATAKVEPNRSAEGHGWMRARAIDALAAAGVLGDAQDPAKVPAALAGIVAEEEAQMFTRCAAARALGKFTYPAGLGVDPVPVAASLGNLAAEIGSTELERAEKEAPPVPVMPAGGYESYDEEYSDEYSDSEGYEEYSDSGAGLFSSGASGMPGARPGAAQPEEGETVVLRRRLKSKLAAVWEGLIGTDRSVAHYLWSRPEAGIRQGYAGISVLATTPEQQKFVDDVLAEMKKLLDLCDDKESPQADLTPLIQEELDSLNQTLAAAPARGAPAAPAAAPKAAPAAPAAPAEDQAAAP